MSKTDDGGAAFPRPASVYGTGNSKSPDDWRNEQEGMSLRDYFAGQALGAVVCLDRVDRFTAEGAARDAYLYADAMIAERNKGK